MSPRRRLRAYPLSLDAAGGDSYIAKWLCASSGGDLDMASEPLFERIADRLKAMADPTRLKILHTLQRGEMCVTTILHEVGGSQANVSKHLSVLRRAGIVDCRREGVNAYYRIVDATVFSICRSVCDSLERQLEAEREEIAHARAAMIGAAP